MGQASNNRLEQFLDDALGTEALAAVRRALAREPKLVKAMPQRAIISWALTAIKHSFDGPIPGQTDQWLRVKKTEDGYIGLLHDGHQLNQLNGDLLEIVSSLAVALDLTPEDSGDVSPTAASRLGKALDGMIGVRLVRQEMELQQDLRKAISLIDPGRPVGPEHHDYSHVLSPKNRDRGYALHVQHDPTSGRMKAHVMHRGQSVGGVKGYHVGENLEVDDADINPEHRNRGLGLSAYEGLMAHGYHQGAKQVVGGIHSSMAGRVHTALARKHGLDYKQAPTPFPQLAAPEPGEYDAKHGPYQYALKGELNPAPSTGPATSSNSAGLDKPMISPPNSNGTPFGERPMEKAFPKDEAENTEFANNDAVLRDYVEENGTDISNQPMSPGTDKRGNPIKDTKARQDRIDNTKAASRRGNPNSPFGRHTSRDSAYPNDPADVTGQLVTNGQSFVPRRRSPGQAVDEFWEAAGLRTSEDALRNVPPHVIHLPNGQHIPVHFSGGDHPGSVSVTMPTHPLEHEDELPETQRWQPGGHQSLTFQLRHDKDHRFNFDPSVTPTDITPVAHDLFYHAGIQAAIQHLHDNRDAINAHLQQHLPKPALLNKAEPETRLATNPDFAGPMTNNGQPVKKGWPKDEAENQLNAAGHKVVQDHLRENFNEKELGEHRIPMPKNLLQQASQYRTHEAGTTNRRTYPRVVGTPHGRGVDIPDTSPWQVVTLPQRNLSGITGAWRDDPEDPGVGHDYAHAEAVRGDRITWQNVDLAAHTEAFPIPDLPHEGSVYAFTPEFDNSTGRDPDHSTRLVEVRSRGPADWRRHGTWDPLKGDWHRGPHGEEDLPHVAQHLTNFFSKNPLAKAQEPHPAGQVMSDQLQEQGFKLGPDAGDLVDMAPSQKPASTQWSSRNYGRTALPGPWTVSIRHPTQPGGYARYLLNAHSYNEAIEAAIVHHQGIYPGTNPEDVGGSRQPPRPDLPDLTDLREPDTSDLPINKTADHQGRYTEDVSTHNGRYLSKNRPGPTYPKLGFPDDRRETDIIDGPRQAEIKGRAQALGARAITATPEARRHWGTEGVDGKRLGDEVLQSGIHVLGALGSVMGGPVTGAHAHGEARRRAAYNTLSQDSQDSNSALLDSKAVPAVQLHENVHGLLNRVGLKHGQDARNNLATHMWAWTMYRAPAAAHAVQESLKRYYGFAPGQRPFEEFLATTLNVANSPADRKDLQTRLGLDDDQMRQVHTAFNTVHQHMLEGGKHADARWLKRDTFADFLREHQKTAQPGMGTRSDQLQLLPFLAGGMTPAEQRQQQQAVKQATAPARHFLDEDEPTVAQPAKPVRHFLDDQRTIAKAQEPHAVNQVLADQLQEQGLQGGDRMHKWPGSDKNKVAIAGLAKRPHTVTIDTETHALRTYVIHAQSLAQAQEAVLLHYNTAQGLFPHSPGWERGMAEPVTGDLIVPQETFEGMPPKHWHVTDLRNDVGEDREFPIHKAQQPNTFAQAAFRTPGGQVISTGHRHDMDHPDVAAAGGWKRDLSQNGQSFLKMEKAWPKDAAENNANAAGHLVTQDALRETFGNEEVTQPHEKVMTSRPHRADGKLMSPKQMENLAQRPGRARAGMGRTRTANMRQNEDLDEGQVVRGPVGSSGETLDDPSFNSEVHQHGFPIPSFLDDGSQELHPAFNDPSQAASGNVYHFRYETVPQGHEVTRHHSDGSSSVVPPGTYILAQGDYGHIHSLYRLDPSGQVIPHWQAGNIYGEPTSGHQGILQHLQDFVAKNPNVIKSELQKTWPKPISPKDAGGKGIVPQTPAENQDLQAHHEVLQDSLMEWGQPQGAFVPVNRATDLKGQQVYPDKLRPGTGQRANTGVTEAVEANAVQNVRTSPAAVPPFDTSWDPGTPSQTHNIRTGFTEGVTAEGVTADGGQETETAKIKESQFWKRIGRAAGIQKKALEKALPKTHAENQQLAAHHQVLQDHLRETLPFEKVTDPKATVPIQNPVKWVGRGSVATQRRTYDANEANSMLHHNTPGNISHPAFTRPELVAPTGPADKRGHHRQENRPVLDDPSDFMHPNKQFRSGARQNDRNFWNEVDVAAERDANTGPLFKPGDRVTHVDATSYPWTGIVMPHENHEYLTEDGEQLPHHPRGPSWRDHDVDGPGHYYNVKWNGDHPDRNQHHDDWLHQDNLAPVGGWPDPIKKTEVQHPRQGSALMKALRKAWPQPIKPQDKGGTHPMRDPAAAATHAVLQDSIAERGDVREVKPRSMHQKVAQHFRDEGHEGALEVGTMGGDLPLDRTPTQGEITRTGDDPVQLNDRPSYVDDRMEDYAENVAPNYSAEELGSATGSSDLGSPPRGHRTGAMGNPQLEYQHPRVTQAGLENYPIGAEDAVREHRLWSSLRNELKKVRGPKLNKGWPKNEKQNQANAAGFVRESPPTEDRLMEQGLSTKTVHTASTPSWMDYGAAPPEEKAAWPTSGTAQDKLVLPPGNPAAELSPWSLHRDPRSAAPINGGTAQGARIWEAQEANRLQNAVEEDRLTPYVGGLRHGMDVSDDYLNDAPTVTPSTSFSTNRFWDRMHSITNHEAKKRSIKNRRIEPVAGGAPIGPGQSLAVQKLPKQIATNMARAVHENEHHPSVPFDPKTPLDDRGRMKKAWPKDEAENKQNAAHHEVLQDHLRETLPHEEVIEHGDVRPPLRHYLNDNDFSMDAYQNVPNDQVQRVYDAADANEEQDLENGEPWEPGPGVIPASSYVQPAVPFGGTSRSSINQVDDDRRGDRTFWQRLGRAVGLNKDEPGATAQPRKQLEPTAPEAPELQPAIAGIAKKPGTKLPNQG